MYTINEERFQQRVEQLIDYVHKEQILHDYKTNNVSFQEGFLYKEEGYKEELFREAKTILAVDTWNSDIIGSGIIRDRIFKILHLKTNDNKEHNLLIWSEKDEIENWINHSVADAEALIYLLFTCRANEEAGVFDEFVSEWGGRYPMISFMFFLKDPERFASIRPENMKTRFQLLGVETGCTKSCTWDNYCEYNAILQTVREMISPAFGDVSLIDAHSFVWAMHLIADMGEDDEELEDLLQDEAQMRLDGFIRHFREALPEYQKEESTLEALRSQFVSDFPVKRIVESMRKEDYVVGLKNPKSFCYRIETELKDLGNMKGATSAKFGLYYGVSGEDKEEKYRFTKKFGNDADEAFRRIQEELAKLIIAGFQKDDATIRESAFSPLFRGKILATYYPDNYFSIFSEEHLDHMLSCLNIPFTETEDVLDKQSKLIAWKNNQSKLKDLSNLLFQRFLYRSFGAPLEKKQGGEDLQTLRDEDYPKDYAEDTGISRARWKRLLKDDHVFRNADIEILKRFYKTDNHAAACKDFALQDGVSHTAFSSPMVALAKRVSFAVGLKPIYRENGSRVWWRILFWGRYREDGCFEWKVQPELAEALAEVFPELDRDIANVEEDLRLLEDLKQTNPDNFEATMPVNAPVPRASIRVSGGSSTYPRDRKIAMNALTLADHKCEYNTEHSSFTRRHSNCRYMEPHHLVPMAYQGEFSNSLDREQNIVSLCSNCHNEIHYGRDAEKLIKSLYDKRKDALAAIGITITLHDLLQMYGMDV